jgi:hypothetical protein
MKIFAIVMSYLRKSFLISSKYPVFLTVELFVMVQYMIDCSNIETQGTMTRCMAGKPYRHNPSHSLSLYLSLLKKSVSGSIFLEFGSISGLFDGFGTNPVKNCNIFVLRPPVKDF